MLCLVKTKACKRCGGDLSLEIDHYGISLECIQCGASWSKAELTHPDTKAADEHRMLPTAKLAATVNSIGLSRSGKDKRP